ncbi:4Fe-4S ferredoxin [Methanomicrobiaceae archaeon CYW5]|uniref:4Fe-4S binding protein n=1 Tax=Methanovulcanius yangii TaxID=1789227 RepID=UPI0029CA5EF5|nr:4Fe-4S binding protein [Methanovulcanius yangii]MBT8506842.1 4Fe-4S ferredoxin [Methanovulcanius yangii]MBT8508929.1 4Fe-4S ferredoxin [Methanovulcanius yangii]MBT8508943.1 4Fe-4S ferredoxin [Methanovulcanius yangii]
MDEDLRESIRQRCRTMDIPLVGIAGVKRWEHPPFTPWMPEAFYPQSIFPEARSVIVIGLPVDLPVLETAPSIYYHELYTTVNTLLDQYTYRLASYLNGEGYPSVFVPRDGYGSIDVLLENPVAFFSHRHAAYMAGLGTFGVNNMLLTPEYGPRVRFGSVLTTAELPEDPVMEEELCTRCMECVLRCPAGALEEGEYPAVLTDKKACAENSERLHRKRIAPCGICLKVCPVGRDRVHFRREDIGMYADKEHFPAHHRAWKHVRSYGGKK